MSRMATETKSPVVTIGVEEEVFLLEAGRLLPTLQSMDVMRKLFKMNRKKYLSGSATNFARGRGSEDCRMSSVETSTGIHTELDALMDDILARRRDFAKAAEGSLVVPIGSLFSLAAPSNTSGLHVHVGVEAHRREATYRRLAYFLPVLAVASACCPYAKNEYWGLSYRIGDPFALGPFINDPWYRFQDLIITRRLGTIEIRVLDPIPNPQLLREVLNVILAIAKSDDEFPLDRDEYNRERELWAKNGPTEWVWQRWEELQEIVSFEKSWLENPLSHRLAEIAKTEGFESAYRHANHIWSGGKEPAPILPFSKFKAVRGFFGYYLFRLPIMAVKGYKEWKATPPDVPKGTG